MVCKKVPINKKDMIIREYDFQCKKRKGHKGMREMTYTIYWWGEEK